MKEISREELYNILKLHKMYLNDEDGGVRADLRGADLRGADLRGADLQDANLRRADLQDADLQGADLRGADLRGADLRRAYLQDTNLQGADLRGADLQDANLRRANLRRADLQDANLRGVHLRRADLRDVNLDCSCLPLWCGSLTANFDDKQLIQIAYHLVKAGLNSKNSSEETKEELKKLVDFANKFHRVDECGVIELGGELDD